MPRHYRWITPSERALLPGASDYDAYASMHAVKVGESGGKDVVDVNRADAPTFTGSFIDDSLAEMETNHYTTWVNVAEARWTDPATGEEVRGKVGDVPDGTTPIEEGLSPNEWA
ncbi:MAG: hypothetical protein R3247_14705 [Rhodothermales bacterium]|nr:hypothetical protein [Rhodothermales bacterium]